MNVEVLERVLKEAQRDERHRTVAETRYWCDQYKAIAEQALAALVREGWVNPNDKTQSKFLPDIGDKVLFCNGKRVYYGHHTGGGFRTGQGATAKYFGTWDCFWMPIPAPSAKGHT